MIFENYINKVNVKHGGKYDYSKVNYINTHTNIKIICPEHGGFFQTPQNHLKGNGCPVCALKHTGNLKKEKCAKNFVSNALKVHGDKKYDYSQINYVDAITKIEIICLKHGVFEQTPHDHLSGYGCPKCGRTDSRSENGIKNFLRLNNIEFIENERTVLKGKEIDIYIPKYKLGIECNGLYWHSVERGKGINYHLNKTELIEKNNIRLLHVFEDEWLFKEDIIKSIIASNLDIVDNNINSNDCNVIEILDNKIIKNFLIKNHILGFVTSDIKLGLFYNDELVSLMIFKKKRLSNEYEILRFCDKLNTRVIDSASKLLENFIKNHNSKSILVSVDRRYCDSGLYEYLGFIFIENTKPNKWCFNANKLKRFRKINKLKNKNKYYHIYDCGNKNFIMRI